MQLAEIALIAGLIVVLLICVFLIYAFSLAYFLGRNGGGLDPETQERILQEAEKIMKGRLGV